MIERFTAWLSRVFNWETEDPQPVSVPLAEAAQAAEASVPLSDNKVFMTMNQERLYNVAKESLGKHMTLNQNVSAEVGCAEAVSKVLQSAGVAGIPHLGIAGTSALYDFLHEDVQFDEVTTPRAGDVIISPTGWPGAVLAHGHVGIVGNYGILSNDSQTGLFKENWTLETWKKYYSEYGNLPTKFFRYV